MKGGFTASAWAMIAATIAAAIALLIGVILLMMYITGEDEPAAVDVTTHVNNLYNAQDYYDTNCPDTDDTTCLEQPDKMNTAVEGIEKHYNDTETGEQIKDSIASFNIWYDMWEQGNCNTQNPTADCNTIGNTTTTAANTLLETLDKTGE